MKDIDTFLDTVYHRKATDRLTDSIKEAEQKLSAKTLKKIAYGLSAAKCIGGGSGGDQTWLDKFTGTPLFDQAIALEQQDIEIEKSRIEQEMSRPDSSQLWKMQDQLRLQRRLLELQLAQINEQAAVGAQPMAPTGAPDPSAPPPMEQPPVAAAPPPVDPGLPKQASASSMAKAVSGMGGNVAKHLPADVVGALGMPAADALVGAAKSKSTLGRAGELLTGSRLHALEQGSTLADLAGVMAHHNGHGHLGALAQGGGAALGQHIQDEKALVNMARAGAGAGALGGGYLLHQHLQNQEMQNPDRVLGKIASVIGGVLGAVAGGMQDGTDGAIHGGAGGFLGGLGGAVGGAAGGGAIGTLAGIGLGALLGSKSIGHAAGVGMGTGAVLGGLGGELAGGVAGYRKGMEHLHERQGSKKEAAGVMDGLSAMGKSFGRVNKASGGTLGRNLAIGAGTGAIAAGVSDDGQGSTLGRMGRIAAGAAGGAALGGFAGNVHAQMGKGRDLGSAISKGFDATAGQATRMTSAFNGGYSGGVGQRLMNGIKDNAPGIAAAGGMGAAGVAAAVKNSPDIIRNAGKNMQAGVEAIKGVGTAVQQAAPQAMNAIKDVAAQTGADQVVKKVRNRISRGAPAVA